MKKLFAPTPPPEPPAVVRAGIACTELIANPKSWVNRRVETTELLSHEETRRRVSVDFTLPDATLDELLIESGVAVPISALTKQPRRNFDVRDESGRAIPVLGRQENGDLAHIALLNAAWVAVGGDPPLEAFEMLAADLRQIVFRPPEEAEDALAFFEGSAVAGDPLRSAVLGNPTCRSLLNTLWSNYVLFVVLTPGGPNRRIVKFSYGDEFSKIPLSERLHPRTIARRLWRPDRVPFFIPYQAGWRAASFHAEIAIPEELRVELATLFNFETGDPIGHLEENVDRAALYAESLVSEVDTRAFVEVAAERSGRPRQAASTSVVVAALLWFGVVSELDAENPGAAVSILLAGAAVFSGYTAIQGGHHIVKTIFKASRRWLGLVSVAALAASASLAMEIPCKHPVDVWVVAAIICTWVAARLTWSWIRAPS
jgi:hypothetical protein